MLPEGGIIKTMMAARAWYYEKRSNILQIGIFGTEMPKKMEKKLWLEFWLKICILRGLSGMEENVAIDLQNCRCSYRLSLFVLRN